MKLWSGTLLLWQTLKISKRACSKKVEAIFQILFLCSFAGHIRIQYNSDNQ